MTSEEQTSSNAVSLKNKDLKQVALEFYKADPVQEVYQALEFMPQAHHITSFELFYQQKAVPKTTLLSDLVSANQKAIVFELKPKAYTGKSILDHVQKVRDIVGLTKNSQEEFGLNSGVSKLYNLDLDPIPEVVPKVEEAGGEAAAKLPQVPEGTKKQISELTNEFYEPLPKNYFTPSSFIKPAVNGLFENVWNPVPLNWKSKGHLVYLTLQTLEGETLQITGSTHGFFINKSSSSRFDPRIRDDASTYFELYNLISSVSKKFHSQVTLNESILNKIDPTSFLQPLTTFTSRPWLTKFQSPTADFGKTQFIEKTQRDFNEEYQSVKELPLTSLPDRIMRERLLTKTAYDFTVEATKGALAILNGEIAPMDPSEESINQIFLHNNIFYSFGVDASGTFADKGGNEASRAASNQDLQALRAFNNIDAKGVSTLLTTIVDYAGRRVVCQTPVPGLFTPTQPVEVKNEETGEIEQVDGEPLTVVNYGNDETSGSIKSSKEFVETLKPIQKAFHFKQSTTEDGAELVTNKEVKGMTGIDKRKYLLDLFNITPLDIEFIEQHFNQSNENSYPHKQAVIRNEAVQEWWIVKVRELIEKESKKQGIDPSKPLKEGETQKELVIDDEIFQFSIDAFESGKEDENVRQVSKFISTDLIPRFINQYNSVSNLIPLDGSQLTFNLHKYGINIRYLGLIAKEIEERISKALENEANKIAENEKLNKDYEARVEERQQKRQEELAAKVEASKRGEEVDFNQTSIPEEEEEEIDEDVEPIVSSVQLKALLAVVKRELVARASKHVLRTYALSLPIELIPSLIVHYHNALLGENFNTTPEAESIPNEEFYTKDQLSFKSLTFESVKSLVAKQISIRYRYEFKEEDWKQTLSQPILIQKEIASKFGIQWNEREYFFDKAKYDEYIAILSKESKSKKNKNNSKAKAGNENNKNIFSTEDVSIVPIIKNSIPRSTSGDQIFEAARQALLSEDRKEEGFTLINESISVYEQVYGQVHTEVGRLYSTISQIYQDMELPREATLFARRAAIINERVNGLDSHDTLISLLNLAYLEQEIGNYSNSIKVYGRLLQIFSSIYANFHVSLPTVLINASLVLQKVGLVKESIKLLNHLIELSNATNGENSYSTAFLKFRLTYLLIQEQRIGEALKTVTQAHKAFSETVSYKYYLTKQARALVERLTSYKAIQEQNAKALKQQQQQQQQQQHKPAVTAKPNAEVASLSVDEIMNFIDGKTSLKKNKKKNHKKKN